MVIVVKNPPANTEGMRDSGSVPGSGKSSGEGNGTPLQYSCLENSLGRGFWWAIVHEAAKRQTQMVGDKGGDLMNEISALIKETLPNSLALSTI